MFDLENFTTHSEIPSLFPVLLFSNKHSNKRYPLEKGPITSEPIHKRSGLSKMDSDEDIFLADNNEILQNADKKPHEYAIIEKTLRQNGFTNEKSIHMVEKQGKCSVRGNISTEKSVPIVHKRVEAVEETYERSKSPEKFSGHSNPIRHKRINSGEKSYEFAECGKKY